MAHHASAERNTETDELVVYGPFSPSARKAIKDSVAVVRRSNRGGMDPVVSLGNWRFPNTHGGINYGPVFTIAAWEYWDGQPAPRYRRSLFQSRRRQRRHLQ